MSYNIILTNKRLHPYKIPNDFMAIQLQIYKNKRLAYLNNIPIEIWFNYEGSWQKYIDSTTNKYGVLNTTYSTSFTIPYDITNCLGYAKATINNNIYQSNIVRFNFLYSASAFELEFIIDAHTEDTDRSEFDIFDGSGRNNIFDRMAGV